MQKLEKDINGGYLKNKRDIKTSPPKFFHRMMFLYKIIMNIEYMGGEPKWWNDALFNFVTYSKNYPELFTIIPRVSDKMMVIVEPRRHHLLEAVLRNFAFYLAPKGWGLMVFHGTDNAQFVRDIVRDWDYVHLVNMGVSNLSIRDYNMLLTAPEFWERIPAEHILIFQTDTYIRKNNVDEFINYDYVGAPWSWMDRGRNGGLSLRRKSATLRALSEKQYNGLNEDVFFSLDCGLNVAPQDVCRRFSVESVLSGDTFGFHKPWVFGHNVSFQMRNYLH